MQNDIQYKQTLGHNIAKNVNLALLIIHTLLFILFFCLRAHIMVYVNALSILNYIIAFYFIEKDSFTVFIRMVYIEIWIHMMIATIVMGWSCGFQLYCFALIPMIYYSTYLSRQQSDSKTYPLFTSIVTTVVFLLVRYYTYYNNSIYEPKLHTVTLGIFSINAAMIFIFLIIYMSSFNRAVFKSEHLLEKMAIYDELTHLYNRHKMKTLLNDAYISAQKGGKEFFITILDIDNFKTINDTYGHGGGDFVLRKIAGFLKDIAEDDITVCRWGGEEFLILHTYYDSPDECSKVIETLREKISNTNFMYDRKYFQLTITCGMATYEPYLTIDGLIKKADNCLYIGKYSGKNQLVIH